MGLWLDWTSGDSSESAGDIGKDFQGFLREHVTLYPACLFDNGVCLGVKDLQDGCFL